MANIARSTISLRIFGADLDPIVLTLRLDAIPTAAAKTGDSYNTKPGETRTVREGFWRLDFDDSSSIPLERIVTELLSTLTQDLQIWREISQTYHVDLFCGLFLETWNEGFTLSPDILKLLAERHIAIGFDIYGADEQTQVAQA